MRRGHLLRLLKGAKTGPVLLKPENVVAPTLVSAEAGVARVGVLIGVTPGVYVPEPASRRYEIYVDGVLESSDAFLLPTEAMEGKDVLGVEIVANAAGETTTFTPELGPVLAVVGEPPPPLGAPYAGASDAFLAKRALFVAAYEGRWEKYASQPFVTDIVVNSMAELDAAWEDDIDWSDRSKWHRIRLNSATLPSAWTASITLRGSAESANPQIVGGHLFDGDRDLATYGGGVLIESTNPANPVMITGVLTMRGMRGFHIRNIKQAVAGKSGLIVTRHSLGGTSGIRYPEAPVGCIENCDLGAGLNPANDPTTFSIAIHVTGHAEQLDVYDTRFKGNSNGVAISEGTFFRVFRCDFQDNYSDVVSAYAKSRSSLVNSTFQDCTFVWREGCTGRNAGNLPQAAASHCDVIQGGTSTNVQHTKFFCDREVFQQSRANATRDMARVTLSTTLPTDGATLTVAGTVFTWRATPTLSTEIQIGVDRRACAAAAKATVMAYGIPNLHASIATSSYVEFHFTKGLVGVVTMAGASTTYDRLRGGMQGAQMGDAAAIYTVEILAWSCYWAVITNGATLYTGDSHFERCTLARVMEMTPNATIAEDGFNADGDGEVVVKSNRHPSSTIPTTHTLKNCVFGYATDIAGDDGVYSANGEYTREGNVTTKLEGCVFVRWAADADVGDRADTLLAGAIAFDSNGMLGYSLQNDGLNSPQDFREEMHSQLKLADPVAVLAAGPVDPADWALAA